MLSAVAECVEPHVSTALSHSRLIGVEIDCHARCGEIDWGTGGQTHRRTCTSKYCKGEKMRSNYLVPVIAMMLPAGVSLTTLSSLAQTVGQGTAQGTAQA